MLYLYYVQYVLTNFKQVDVIVLLLKTAANATLIRNQKAIDKIYCTKYYKYIQLIHYTWFARDTFK